MIGHSTVDSTIPVSRGVIKAIAHCNGAVTFSLNTGKHVLSQTIYAPVDGVMFDVQKVITAMVGGADDIVPYVTARFNILFRIVKVSLCIEIEISDVIAEVRHDGLAFGVAI